MSIALSAIIRPSRVFSVFSLGFATIFFLTCILIGLGNIGSFGAVTRQLLALGMALGAVFLIFIYFTSRKTLRIDISGNGQICLTEDRRGVSKPSSGNTSSSAVTEIWELSENSTVWPSCLILQLKAKNGKKIRVLIFQDSVKEEQFKSLYTSIRWIEARKNNV